MSEFEKCLKIIEETLSRIVFVRQATKASRHELETQLWEFKTEHVTAKKIQAKASWALVVENEEVKCLVAFFIEE